MCEQMTRDGREELSVSVHFVQSVPCDASAPLSLFLSLLPKVSVLVQCFTRLHWDNSGHRSPSSVWISERQLRDVYCPYLKDTDSRRLRLFLPCSHSKPVNHWPCFYRPSLDQVGNMETLRQTLGLLAWKRTCLFPFWGRWRKELLPAGMGFPFVAFSSVLSIWASLDW